MSISAKEAATLTGVSKQAIIKSINLGKISAVKDVDGSWQIEPVELFRYYPPLSTTNGNGHQSVDGHQQEVASLSVEVQQLRERLDDKDDALRAAYDQIADLRQRLDTATEENQRLSLVVTSQLSAPQPERKGWWARLLGGA